ncbi:TonB-dependent receptor plug domain-containing protein [Brumimicrobium mesophilum]|uniref:TonB-dependent receptor plug domain-containing protein n=1 Tax=Brumimicrobium mesophilum TaxID=392717 RepID=UPI000D13F908|nr:TonB-dependent receptor plug domain-containing protein [Brumimicrobium mesophilum]
MKIKLFSGNSILTILSLILISSFANSQVGVAYGKVISGRKLPIPNVEVKIGDLSIETKTDKQGNYILSNIPYGTHTIEFISEGFIPEESQITITEESNVYNKTLSYPVKVLEQMEVFGYREEQPDKLDAITRLPLLPTEQIQSISIISQKLIEQQGNLSISEATRNVAGIYTYATYGGVRESMSSRGFRGIPVLKNGVRIHTDFRGQGFSTDFSGVESIQVLKGANSINMGSAADLGSPGGIINVVTKSPKFKEFGYVTVRVGSFNQVRPTFDVENVLGKEGKVSFRLNGAYENVRTFQNIEGIGQEKFYINPSLAWRPDNKTEIILEMDYLNDVRAFDPGTVNLDPDNRINDIYELPMDRFLGFKGNNAIQKTTTYTARFKRDIAPKLYLRGAVYIADYDSDAIVSSIRAIDKNDSLGYNTIENSMYKRSIGKSNVRNDKSTVIQMDLIGHNIKTGIFKHTFQAGIDFRSTYLKTESFNSLIVDTINVTEEVNNNLPGEVEDFTLTGTQESNTSGIGISAQEVLQIGERVRLFGGVRFGTSNSSSPLANTNVTGTFVNPIAGAMVKVWKDLSLFGSYTNSTNPRTAAYVDVDGNPLGNETISQFEAGIKSSWFKDRLRFNATYYFITNKGMNIRAAVENPVTDLIELQNYYFQGGNDERKGIELELVGRVLENLELIVGYSYIDAQYKEHTTFVPGSSPNGTPSHTLNAYLNYSFETGMMQGLSIGAGFYYLGDRPYNDWTQGNVEYHGISPNLEPWNNKAYSLLNAQVNYNFKNINNETLQNFNVRFLANNIMNTVGYDAYRTSFINRVTPRNFSVVIGYRF